MNAKAVDYNLEKHLDVATIRVVLRPTCLRGIMRDESRAKDEGWSCASIIGRNRRTTRIRLRNYIYDNNIPDAPCHITTMEEVSCTVS
jgi:hypothetical protein